MLSSLLAVAEPPQTPNLEFFKDGKQVRLSQDCSASVVADALRLFDKTGATSSPEIATLDAWQERARGTYLHVTWGHPKLISVRHSDRIEVTELLIPMNNGFTDHLLARHRDHFWAFTKYDPHAFGELACKSELALDGYAKFCEWFAHHRDERAAN
jgi:hypothetical protein